MPTPAYFLSLRESRLFWAWLCTGDQEKPDPVQGGDKAGLWGGESRGSAPGEKVTVLPERSSAQDAGGKTWWLGSGPLADAQRNTAIGSDFLCTIEKTAKPRKLLRANDFNYLSQFCGSCMCLVIMASHTLQF